MTSTTPPEIASKVESYIPRFKLTRLLNQDQAGRRISLLGTIDSLPAVLIAERAAFATDNAHLSSFPTSLTKIKNLGANDIYSWFLANSNSNSSSPADGEEGLEVPPDFKLNLIYPCTEKHIKKYSAQPVRMVTETPEIYTKYILPWIQKQREKGALNWIYNILEGRTEQEDVIYRESGPEGFLLLPDLNWDRKTLSSLHLLGLVERRDIWSVRDLDRGKVEWVRHMREKLVSATVGLYPEIERDQIKLYVHYQPTYHHFHVHVVHAALESGGTQAVGKAIGLESVVELLECMAGGPEAGFRDVSLTYGVGEQSELWEKVFGVLKRGEEVDVENF
ncbi:scavenger mRNA decapping enzyme [Byssothecium circinans]|uniref:Scavenger mRNA decapping enzyme n=1 Tax=Byssothecium circinans TaxID=147558 RepID=A0A6A5TSS4_9PLEO|nr:scavenger mRNA decapping enzyme [Byssothecium circinans]